MSADENSREQNIAGGCLTVAAVVIFLLFFFGASIFGGSERSTETADFRWRNYDVDVTINADGSAHVRETQLVTFGSSRTWRVGYAEIPMERIDSLRNVQVSTANVQDPTTPLSTLVTTADLVESRQISSQTFSKTPHTFSAVGTGSTFRIDYGFEPTDYTTGQSRLIVLEYDVTGVVRLYPDAAEPWEQLHWMAISSDVTDLAPIDESTVTITLPERADPAALGYAPEPATNNGRTLTWIRSNLTSGSAFDVQVQFPLMTTGTVAPRWQAAADEHDRSVVAAEGRSNAGRLMVILASAGAVSLGVVIGVYGWFTGIREPQIDPAQERISGPPDDLTAGLVGVLVDEEVHPRDVAAAVIDLHRRGILAIERTDDNPNNPWRYTLATTDGLDTWETKMLEAVFGRPLTVGKKIDSQPFGVLFNAYRPELTTWMMQALVDRGLLVEMPEVSMRRWRNIARTVQIIGAIAAVVIGIWARLPLWWLVLPIAVTVLIGWLLNRLTPRMARKTSEGAESAARWRAYQRELESNAFIAPAAERAANAWSPYRIAFGLESGWLQELNRPSWTYQRGVGDGRRGTNYQSTDQSPLRGWDASEAKRHETVFGSSTDRWQRGSSSGWPTDIGSLPGRSWGGWNSGTWGGLQSGSDSMFSTLSSGSNSVFEMAGDVFEAIGKAAASGGGSSGGSSGGGGSSRSSSGGSRSSSGGGSRGFG